MAERVDRVERLLNLLLALRHAARPLTRDELRERLLGYPADDASFRRAFERDKEALREMGVPLEVQPVPGTDPPIDGYRVSRKRYDLADPGLTPEEAAAVKMATIAVQLQGLESRPALWKLGGAPGDDVGPTIAAVPTIPQLVPLFDAVAKRAPVEFAYRGERRHVDPHRLSHLRGRWYLDGHDHDRGARRQFRVDRIEGMVDVGASRSFERPADLPDPWTAPWLLGEGEAVRARIRVDADQAPWAVDEVGEEAVVRRHRDGAVDIEIPVVNRDGFRSFVLGFLEHAEVLGPPELRDDIVQWLEQVASR